jgi:serine O-acetyltransferase
MNEALWKVLRADLYRYREDTSRSALRSALRHEPGFRYTYYMRNVAHYAKTKRSTGVFAYMFHRMQLNRYRFKYGFEISPTTSIGPGLYIGHFGGVVISPYAVLGANVNIAQGVTIGAESRGQRKGAPVLGDRVWVGAHSIIVGKVVIGHDALIAPGAFVNFDVPSGSVVLGNPGKIVSQRGSAGYVNKILEDV